MLSKLLVSSLLVSVTLSSTLLASSSFIPNLNEELTHNKELIKEYKNSLNTLAKRDKFLNSVKAKHPKLYAYKPLYEDTKSDFIYRIKLNGAEAKNVNFKIQNHMIGVDMNIKVTRNDKSGYYESSQSFYEDYSIPKNVKESKITHYIDGDYFVIKMPKQKVSKS